MAKTTCQGRHAVDGVVQFLHSQEYDERAFALEGALKIQSSCKPNQDKDVKSLI